MNNKYANDNRAEELGSFIIKNNCTVRMAAKYYGVSKSTVHKDVTDVLKNINSNLYSEVRKILDKNKSERHLRGGEATKQKYLEKQPDNRGVAKFM